MRNVIALLVILAGLVFASPSGADVVTELGAGVKIPASTSYVLTEECHVIYSYLPGDRPVEPFIRSCGGDDPLFIGWPVAWQKDFGVWTIRAGWFHLSHWFDGGPDREVHMDCACATFTINWTERRKVRRVKLD